MGREKAGQNRVCILDFSDIGHVMFNLLIYILAEQWCNIE